MKKIVFVIESLSLGGAERSLVTLLQNLDYSIYEVDLILFKKGGHLEVLVPEEVKVDFLRYPALNLLERVSFFLNKKIKKNHHPAQSFWSLVKNKFYVVEKKYDVAIAYNQGLATYFTGSYIKANKKYSWLNTDYKKAGYNIKFDYRFYNKFDKIILVSPESCNVFKDELLKNKLKLKTIVIKDITDKKALLLQSEEYGTAEYQKSTFNILTVGRLEKYKAIHLAIESCNNLVELGHNVSWFVIGEGTEKSYLQKLVLKYNLKDNFHFLGAKTNPYPYMKNCDIYVQTSLFEGLGLTVIEASYFNKPIVCTNFPTVKGIINDKETGLIVAMNAESITEKVEKLIVDEGLRTKLVTNLSLKKNKDTEESLMKFKALILQ